MSRLLRALCSHRSSAFRASTVRASSSEASAFSGLPTTFLKSLGSGWLTCVKIDGSGRGLIALKDIPQGTEICREHPMLSIPAHQHMILPSDLQQPSQRTQVCYHCLGWLGPDTQHHPESRQAFCSHACMQTACSMYHEVECHADLGPLQRLCSKSGKARLPLMVARLACQHVTARAAQLSCAGSKHSAGSDAHQVQELRGDATKDMSFLCYAKVPHTPEEWQQQWAALLLGLQQAAAWMAGRLASDSSHYNNMLGEGRPTSASPEEIAAGLLAGLDESWYAGCLARLHVNVFRVDTVVMPPYQHDSPRMSLDAQMAMLLGGGEDSQQEGAGMGTGTGSAAYVTASLFNHSCEPNLDVVFPTNNNVLAVRASRDIGAGEQLTITYCDPHASVKVRQQHLQFAYGFACQCALCTEQLAELRV